MYCSPHDTGVWAESGLIWCSVQMFSRSKFWTWKSPAPWMTYLNSEGKVDFFFFFNSEKSNTNLLEKNLITDSIIKNLFSKIICHAENDNKNHCSEDDVHVLDWEELVMYRKLLITHVTTVLLNVFNDTKKAQTLQILMVTVCYFCTVTRLWVGDWYCSRLLDSWQLQKRTNHTEEPVSLQESSKRPASFKAFTLCWGLWVTCTSEKLLLRKPIQLFESPPN